MFLLRYLFRPLVDDLLRRLKELEDRQDDTENVVEKYLDQIDHTYRRFIKRQRDAETADRTPGDITGTSPPRSARVSRLRARRLRIQEARENAS